MQSDPVDAIIRYNRQTLVRRNSAKQAILNGIADNCPAQEKSLDAFAQAYCDRKNSGLFTQTYINNPVDR